MDDTLRGSLWALTYALWIYSCQGQTKITIQLKLIQRFVALIGSVSAFSEFMVICGMLE